MAELYFLTDLTVIESLFIQNILIAILKFNSGYKIYVVYL